jgi:hypothetical protein
MEASRYRRVEDLFHAAMEQGREYLEDLLR